MCDDGGDDVQKLWKTVLLEKLIAKRVSVCRLSECMQWKIAVDQNGFMPARGYLKNVRIVTRCLDDGLRGNMEGQLYSN